MNGNDIYVAMYHCLATLHGEEPNKDLGNFLIKANPYILNGKGAADPEVKEKFEKFLKSNNQSENISEEIAYNLVIKYLQENTKFGDFFQKNLPFSDWLSLCLILEQEKSINLIRELEERAISETGGISSNSDVDAIF